MKEKRTRIRLFLMAFVSLLLVGCGSDFTSYDSTTYTNESQVEDDIEVGGGVDPDNIISQDKSSDEFAEENLKIVRTINMIIETTKFNESIKSIEKLTKDYKGFVAQSSNSTNGGYYGNRNHRVASYQLKIPKDNLDSFLSSAGFIGEIVSRDTLTEDMSEHYYDTESRLNVLKTKKSRVLELLDKAEKMEDILTLENTLSNIIYEKERLTGTLKGIDNRVSYSTVFLELEEVERIIKAETIEKTFRNRALETFLESLAELKEVAQELALLGIYLLPFGVILLILAPVGFFVYSIISKFNEKRKKKQREKNEKIRKNIEKRNKEIKYRNEKEKRKEEE